MNSAEKEIDQTPSLSIKPSISKTPRFKTFLHSKKMLAFLLMLPLTIWLFVFLICPYVTLFSYSFWKASPFNVIKEFNLGNYTTFFALTGGSDAPYTVLLKTVEIALAVTFFTIILSFPLAYYINFKVKRHKQLLYMLVIIPLWVSYIVRAYAWKIILGSDGILNSALMWVGVTHHPLQFLLYSKVSVIIAMTHIYLPFVLMPIYTAMEQIPRSLIEASSDLGARGIKTFVTVTLPLTLKGVISGGTFAFVLSMGDFIAPSLLGGPDSSTMIANVMQQQFGTSNNWPYGAAIGVIILILVLVLLEITGKAEKRFSYVGSGTEGSR